MERYVGFPSEVRICSQCVLNEICRRLKINSNFCLFVQNITMKIAFNGNNPKNQKFFSLTPAEKLIWILNNEIEELLCLLGFFFEW